MSEKILLREINEIVEPIQVQEIEYEVQNEIEEVITYEIVPFEQPSEDEQDSLKLNSLMKEFDLEIIIPYLKASQITYRSLKYLSKEDISKAIPPIGLQAEFREKLFIWRKTEYNMEDDTLSAKSRIMEWLEKSFESKSKTPQLSSVTTTSISYASMDIRSILTNNGTGQLILKFYEENFILHNTHRQEIIRIITEEVMNNNIYLKPTDFQNITNQIIAIFPTETEMKDYYYVPRNNNNKRKNPLGKLYDRYTNARSKNRKLTTPSNVPSGSIENSIEEEEIDESISAALKTCLKRENNNWHEICDKWSKTFKSRQKDLKSKDQAQFLLEWPKFKHPKAPELIEIDFNLQYPNNKLRLFSKWENFKTKIKQFYSTSITNPSCKQMFNNINNAINIDSEDVIVALLLNSIILPTARFKDKASKLNRKASIVDAQESFLLHLVSINNYENKIEELTHKYFNIGVTVQPFIIVVGGEITSLTKFYIFFDKTLFEFKSFIECLDSCFKLFQVLNLKYPAACIGVWNFIQKFFYEITTTYDIKSPNLSILLNYLKA